MNEHKEQDRTASLHLGDGQPHILIVENDSGIIVSLAKTLKEYRPPSASSFCEVDIATDIEAARSFLSRDEIDIYIVDLKMPQTPKSGESEEAGKNFVREIISNSTAGIIVLTSLPDDEDSNLESELLDSGADDYIQKYPSTDKDRVPENVKSRVRAVWRRTQLLRTRQKKSFAHSQRVFKVGSWRFAVGDRALSKSNGETIKLSPTEHAFLRYICTVEDHRVDAERFNVEILNRNTSERHHRIDNFIYRLREKLGPDVQLLSQRGDGYQLIDLKELKPQS